MFPETESGQHQAHTIWTSVSRGKSWYGPVEKITRSGDSYFVNMLAIPVPYTEDKPFSVTILEIDITEDVHSQDQLQQIAYIDYESGLMSRYKLELMVNEFIEEEKHFSFVFLSIDHYYTLKDLQSFESKKELVKSFSNRLKRYLPR